MTFDLHHVALASPKAAEATEFYIGEWGLHEVYRDESVARLGTASDRGDDYSLMLLVSDQKTVDHYSLATTDEAEYDELATRIRSKSVTLLPDAPPSPGMAKSLFLVDLDGRRVEIGYRPAADGPTKAPAVDDAIPQRVAHIVLNTPDIHASTSWYEDVFGFGVRDWREEQMSFIWTNADHHTICFNQAPHVSLNHIAYELADINEFFRGVGRATREKLYGPGRHGPGDYIFCYFLDPMEFICEYETDGVKIHDPEEYAFRVWKFSDISSDQWLGTLSGGLPPRFKEAAVGVPDPGVLAPTS